MSPSLPPGLLGWAELAARWREDPSLSTCRADVARRPIVSPNIQRCHPSRQNLTGGRHDGENVKLTFFFFWLDDVIGAAVMTSSWSTVICGVYMGRSLRLQVFHVTSRCVVNVLYVEASALGHRGS